MESQTVLCVDDDFLVREVTRAALERAGFRVLAAASGEDAVAVLASVEEPIRIVLLDWIMPGLSGVELVERVRRLCPETKILLTSGYSHIGALPLIARKVVDGFLPKPYSPRRLVEHLERTLHPVARAAAGGSAWALAREADAELI